MAKTKSGKYWVDWANEHAQTSASVVDLAPPFKGRVEAFIEALEAAGATVHIEATRRDPRRAYLFHWSWRIGLGKAKPSEAKPMAGVEIEWDHGSDAASREGAMEIVRGFNLAIPPRSNVPPALHSHHLAGTAIDMDIAWNGILRVKLKNGREQTVPWMSDPNKNIKLHKVGASYGVRKLATDAPHWSSTGH
ncbi:MAG: hypothetical protein KF774_15865 [Planctomyces sp.]|nr:hypothetical protein [Planctomyces sp.]